MADAKRARSGSSSTRPSDSHMSEACAGCRMAKVRCERMIPCLRCLRRNERCMPQHHSDSAGVDGAGVSWQILLQPPSASSRGDAHATATEVVVRRVYRLQLEGTLAVHKARQTLAAISHAQSHTGLDIFRTLLPSLARVCGLQPMSGLLPSHPTPTHTPPQPPPPEPLLSQNFVRQLAPALNVPSCADDDLAVALWPVGGHSFSVNRVFEDTFVRGSAIHTLLHSEALAAPYMVSWLFELPDQDAFLHALADLLFSATDTLQLQLRATDKHSTPLTCRVCVRLLQSPNSCGSIVMAVIIDRTPHAHDVTSVLPPTHTPADDHTTLSDTSLTNDPTELRRELVEPCVVRGGMGMGAGGIGIGAGVEWASDLGVHEEGLRGVKRSREGGVLLHKQQAMPLLQQQQGQHLQLPPYHHPQPQQHQIQQQLLQHQESSHDQPQQDQQQLHQPQQLLVSNAVVCPLLSTAVVHTLPTELPHIPLPQPPERLLRSSSGDWYDLHLPEHQSFAISQQHQQQQQQQQQQQHLTPLLLQQQPQGMASLHPHQQHQHPLLVQQESTPLSIASLPTTASIDSALTTIASTPSLSSSSCPSPPPPTPIFNANVSTRAHSELSARVPTHTDFAPTTSMHTHPSEGAWPPGAATSASGSGLWMQVPPPPPPPLMLAQDSGGRSECVTAGMRAGGDEMGLQGVFADSVLFELDEGVTESMPWL